MSSPVLKSDTKGRTTELASEGWCCNGWTTIQGAECKAEVKEFVTSSVSGLSSVHAQASRYGLAGCKLLC